MGLTFWIDYLFGFGGGGGKEFGVFVGLLCFLGGGGGEWGNKGM